MNATPHSILMTARNRSGSWQIRGEQLGAAIQADRQLNAEKLNGHALVVLVKRPRPDLLYRIKRAGKPIVWDVVDAWPQPEGNTWGQSASKAWLQEAVAEVGPVAIVTGTLRMAADCVDFGLPLLPLPHHARPDQKINPIRERVRTVGYEGGAHYLGHWMDVLLAECRRRDWDFVVNPRSLADLDIVVAFRSHKGYPAKFWKSNVKLANAQGSGTPCILNRESGYLETARSGEVWADTEEELREAFDRLTPHEERVKASAQLRAAEPKLNDIAATYRQWLDQLKF